MLEPKFREVRFLRLPSSGGRAPLSWFEAIAIVVSWLSCPSSRGRLPVSRLSFKLSSCKVLIVRRRLNTDGLVSCPDS